MEINERKKEKRVIKKDFVPFIEIKREWEAFVFFKSF